MVFLSFACLAASICVVSPRLALAWLLGFEYQIIAIGFLLSMMNFFMGVLSPTLFLIIESRWGSSNLQNYDAILRNSVTISKTGRIWKTTIFVFILLPTLLSVGYKRFIGGTSSFVITGNKVPGFVIANSKVPGRYGSKVPGHYGLAPPPLGAFTSINNSVYFMIDANVRFLAASSNDSVPPQFASLPIAYGYNTLLLSNTPAALLDMPLPDYMSSIQQNLAGDEFWEISATVNATVTRYNTSTEAYRSNDSFWQETMDKSNNPYQRGLSTFHEFNGYALGFLPGIPSESDGASCLLGHYRSPKVIWNSYITNLSDPYAVAFRAAALMFNTRRERCHGTWKVNSTNIILTNGSCDGVQTSQAPLSSHEYATPFPLDALPVLVQALRDYSRVRSQSPWLLPAVTTAVATSYWSRLAYMLPSAKQEGKYDSELNYLVPDELIESTTSTLEASWLLYFLLALQPGLTLFMFIATTLLYSSPVSKEFGMIAVLSGINKESLHLLSGASLSGTLNERVRLDISVVDGVRMVEGKRSPYSCIEYTIDGSSQGKHGEHILQRGKKYE